MKIINLPIPLDVAPIISENKSLMLVILFNTPERAEIFHQHFIFNQEISLDVLENEDKTFTFVLHSSNSPQYAAIKTRRTVDNNPPLKAIADNDFKDYVYLTFGYKKNKQVLYNQSHSYPVFLNYKSEE
ncbi:hypothetical protein [Flavobacterium sp. GSP14]|uniref:hypothetical protein n=1 Tax=Flavobacterium sp. GSP14 TaxID=3401734 RepID=UPI003AB0027C